MRLTRIMCLAASMLVAIAAKSQLPASQAPKDQPTRTKVVLLGTGTPVPDPDRSGPATAIVVDDRAYLVDFGPGVVRRAESAALNKNIPAVRPRNDGAGLDGKTRMEISGCSVAKSDDSTPQLGQLNDLWKYSGGQWTWMSGANTVNQAGVYGTLGATAAGNVPGARWSAVSWTPFDEVPLIAPSVPQEFHRVLNRRSANRPRYFPRARSASTTQRNKAPQRHGSEPMVAAETTFLAN